MKFNIRINQKALSKTNLDLFDCAILDYIIFYCSSANEKIEKQRIRNENGVWTWINYQTLLKDMPLLRIKSSGALTPRIKKIEKEGFFTTLRQGNQKLFIKMNEKADELFIEVNRPIHENKQLSVKSYSRRRTNNNTIYNNTINKRERTPSQKMNFFLIDEEEPKRIARAISENSSFSYEEVLSELKNFAGYWVELNKSGKKQRWQLQKTFELKRRLGTWFRNKNKFNNKSNKGKKIII